MPDPSVPSAIGVPFIELQTVDSTNNYAFRRIHSKRRRTGGQNLSRNENPGSGSIHHGMAIFAHEQTAGKGQRGKKWVSTKGQNVALSIVVEPAPLGPGQQFALSACTAVAVSDVFHKYAGDETTIKWPNDLYWRDRKAGGLLIESIIGIDPSNEEEQTSDNSPSAWLWAVVGIGININQVSFPPELPNPTSLKQITGRDFDPVQIAQEICQSFNGYFQRLISGGFQEIFLKYVSRLYKLNQQVKLKKDNRVFEATIKGVSTNGRLITRHGIEEEFDFGTIEWLINQQ